MMHALLGIIRERARLVVQLVYKERSQDHQLLHHVQHAKELHIQMK